MTIEKAGRLGGRAFGEIHGEDGNVEAWRCLACGADTEPDRKAFEAHTCGKAAKPAPRKKTSRKRAAKKAAAAPAAAETSSPEAADVGAESSKTEAEEAR